MHPSISQDSMSTSAAEVEYTSLRSLPDFRARPKPFYYAEPSEASAEERLVRHGYVHVDPELPYMRVRGYGGRWVVCCVKFKNSSGRDDWLAAKQTELSGFLSEKHAFAEYELLRNLDHPHIIAAVGAYKLTNNGPVQVGALLYPLAPNTLAARIKACSEYNDAESRAAGRHWRISDSACQLLPFFACICDALSYLHGLMRPVKHKDIKTANILIDKCGTVILADFDRAETYDSKEAAISQGPGDRTNQYASPAVMKQEDRGFDRDVAPLGFVFVEMATVVLGETLNRMKEHCKHELWFQRLDAGLLDSWIEFLRKQTYDHPRRIPADFTRIPGRILIDRFLDVIKTMAHAGINDQDVLGQALDFFRQLPKEACKHCGPGALIHGNSLAREAISGNHVEPTTSPSRDYLTVPGTPLDPSNLQPTPRPPKDLPVRPSDIEIANPTNNHQLNAWGPEIKISTTNTSLERISSCIVSMQRPGSELETASSHAAAIDSEWIPPQLEPVPSECRNPHEYATRDQDLGLFESLSPDISVPKVLRIGPEFSSASHIEGVLVFVKTYPTSLPKLKWRYTIGRDMTGYEVCIVPLYEGKERRRHVKLWDSEDYLLEKLLPRRVRMLCQIGLLRTMLFVVSPRPAHGT